MKKRSRGYSLIELVVAVAILGFLVFIMVALEREIVSWDRKTRLDLFTQPESAKVIHRFRKDVMDAKKYHSGKLDDYEQSDTTLLLDLQDDKSVVWDFSNGDVVKRIEYDKGTAGVEWTSKTRVTFRVTAYQICIPSGDPDVPPSCSGTYFTHLIGSDRKGNVIVDQIVIPRAL